MITFTPSPTIEELSSFLKDNYRLGTTHVQLLQNMDDWVYQVEDDSGRLYKLKLLQKPARNVQQKFHVVTTWLKHLNQVLDVNFAVALPNAQGAILTTVTFSGFKLAVLYPWQSGEILEEYEVRKMYELGRLVGKMHTATTSYQAKPIESARIDHFWVISRVQPLLNGVGLLLNMSYEEEKRLSDNIEYLARYLQDLGYDQSFGWIHSDLHRNNLIVQDEQVTILDFDDALQAHFMVDLGVLFNEFEEYSEDGHKFRSSFLNGYQKIRPLDVPKKQLYLFQHIADMIYAHWLFSLAQRENQHPKLQYGWQALQNLIQMKQL